MTIFQALLQLFYVLLATIGLVGVLVLPGGIAALVVVLWIRRKAKGRSVDFRNQPTDPGGKV